MNKPIPIKPFKTLDAEAHFWDTHDVSSVLEDKKIELAKLPILEKEKEDVLILRIQKSVKQRLEKTAQSKGINPSTLARMWIIEHLQSGNI